MNARPFVTLVAIVSADGYISAGEGVPWNLPRDKRHFRAATQGQWLLIGRRTYEEMIGWFTDHHPLVLTRDQSYVAPVGQVVSTVGEALGVVQQGGGKQLVVVGGGPTFEAAMPVADRLLMTYVPVSLGGGVPFPAISPSDWVEMERQEYPTDAENSLPMAFVTYGRRERHPGKPG